METPAQSKIIFPYFEKGLPLRSRDLNAVFRRADEEVRHTRTCLHGMGILYGLHVSVKEATITIQAGAGVTSQGYLYCSHTPVQLTNIASQPAAIIKRKFTEESFGDFLDIPSTDAQLKDTIAHLELDTTGLTIAGIPLANKWLIIFLEIVSEKLEGCANCEKGTRAEVKTKFLLIDKATWEALTKELFNKPDTAPATPPAKITPVLLRLPRLWLSNNGCIDVSGNDLGADYSTIVNTHFPEIKAELKRVLHLADTVFGLGGEAVADQLNVPALLAGTNAQYVHDYLRLIIRAYNEFISTAFARHMANLPLESQFPKHLVLGKFNEAGVFSEQERTPLFRPPFDDTTDPGFEHARKLYERLISLLTNHDFGKLNTKTELRITPSRKATFPIGNQAVPFYLNATIKESWRPDTQFQGLIPHYDDLPVNAKSLQQQPYFDEADFYRIEGHVGQPLNKLLRELTGNNDNDFGKRACLNLSFEVVVVSLQGSSESMPNLRNFARRNPGLEHQGGVPAGGTFVLVISGTVGEAGIELGSNTIVGDFCLPYWVQPPVPKPVVADFEIIAHEDVPGKGESFTFKSTSQEAERLEWRVNGGDSLSENTEFEHFFPIGDSSVTHYFVTLTAMTEERISVEKATIVVVHIPQKLPPPQADFAVEENDTVDTSEDGRTITIKDAVAGEGQPFIIELAFENLSDNADKYAWKIDDDELKKPKTKDKLIHQFVWERDDIGQLQYVVQLTASRNGQPDSVVQKTVEAIAPVQPPID